MKMKLWLYAGFLVIFTIVFSQVAFPFSATVKSVAIRQAASGEGMSMYDAVCSNAESFQDLTLEYLVRDIKLKEADNHVLLEYKIAYESTGLIPIDIVKSRLEVDRRYMGRVIVRAVEPVGKKVSTFMPAGGRFNLLVDVSGMTEDEIRGMIDDIQIHVTWQYAPGLVRENKAYLPGGIVAG